MSRHSDKFEFSAKENEQIDAIIKIESEKNSIIHGLVVDCKNNPVKNAVVKLLEKVKTSNGIKIIPITHTFTDCHGNFIFGPLCPNMKYVIKVWYDDVVIRRVSFCGNTDDSYCLKGELHEDHDCENHEHNSHHHCGCDDSSEENYYEYRCECENEDEEENCGCNSQDYETAEDLNNVFNAIIPEQECINNEAEHQSRPHRTRRRYSD